MSNGLLELAIQCTDEQIARLRRLLQEAATRIEPVTSDLRQIGRPLDEI